MALLANLRLAGVPFISAFYSKEIYLEEISQRLAPVRVLLLFYFRVILTALYSMRFLALYYASVKKSFRLTATTEKD
jgi:NADH:ubiquinone oxidoreductase subunit 5 (subunit L)/multisubunit Na+/H+ antiporter MnhA subunit